MYLIDDFVTTQPGEPFRLFPFGTIYKNGKKHEITKELAAKMRLPHFKPPIKLGSHNDTTPAGGHIIALEVRSDGLYAIPEFTEQGVNALSTGAYRYHSPEIIWEGGGLEDPVTGQIIEGPLIVGDALLHTPHLGEATALFTVEPINNIYFGGDRMTDNTVTLPASFWEKLTARFFEDPKQEPEPPQVQEFSADEFKAIKAEAEQYKAEAEKLKAEQERAQRVTHFASELKETTLNDDKEVHELLASLPEDKAKLLLQKFTALTNQIKESNLTADLGNPGNGADTNPFEAFDSAIRKVMAERKVDYGTATAAVVTEQPELYAAYQRGGR